MADVEKRVRGLLRRRGDGRPRRYEPGPFTLVYGALLAAGLAGAGVVYSVLVHLVPGMTVNRADTMKTALLVIGGAGALAGLYVSYRKQRTDEANHVRDQDKLFTERYTAAAAQLGHDKAAVRLAGVYALARIADDSVRDRPTCLEVLCAYLRMPYDADDPAAEPAERQVRTTAQSAIAARLRSGHPGFWTGARVNLADAYLIEPQFDDITVDSFNATKATFSGDAGFGGARFSGYAWFDKATFSGDAGFGGATFSEAAGFDGATFSADAGFGGATFSRGARFGEARFSRYAWFDGATFSGDAGFGGATFSEAAAWFDKTTFSGNAGFDGAAFRRDRPPQWPDGFAEPAGIVWTDPPAPAPDPADPDPDPPADPVDPPNRP